MLLGREGLPLQLGREGLPLQLLLLLHLLLQRVLPLLWRKLKQL